MRATLVEQISQTLANRFGPEVQLILSLSLLDQPAWELVHSGAKSFVWSSEDRVLKVYWSGGVRDLERIAHSYETAYRENPDLFPKARRVGTGKIMPQGPDLLVIEQARIFERQPSYHFNPHEWEVILAKWDKLIARHTRPIPLELHSWIERLAGDDEAAYHEISQQYADALASVQAPTALQRLRDRHIIIIDAPDLPQPQLSSVSKIVGDVSPKHVLLDGPGLAFDLEKYGLGDPAKDLSTILRFYLYRHDPVNAGRVLKYLRERYNDPSLIYRMYLAALGSGSRLLYGTSSETVRERYQAVLDFYPVAHKYFS